MSDKNLSYRLYQLMWGLVDLVIPPACGGCDKYGVAWCAECECKVQILNGTLCVVCGVPQEKEGVCNSCLAEQPHFRVLRAWSVFDGPVREALHKLKYQRAISLGWTLASQMLDFVKVELNWPVDAVVPVPLGRSRLRERGYNQVETIAKPLALGLGLQYFRDGLKRHKETRSQVGLTKSERRENIRDAFVADARVKGKSILVVDDVSTTGATLSAGAEALFLTGAKDVYALTVARALPQHGLESA
ncbi:MAG: ComF family protein [Anaerolineales bacterium]|nr:ComF family protein [Anaerolineales bacterium]